MSDVQLMWPNKELELRACDSDAYVWCQRGDARLRMRHAIRYQYDAPPTNVDNVVAIGDGLDVLEALSAETNVLEGGIRVVYIDPPFNTQVNFRQYRDSMQRAAWLSMMRDRLRALRPFLTSDSSVWVHLDDAEVHRARSILDEEFGEDAFVSSIIWQKKTTRDSRAAFSSSHDTILVYAPAGPRLWKRSRNLLVKEDVALRNRDGDPRGPWSDAPFTAPGIRDAQQYEITTPSGNTYRPPRGRSWYATEPKYQELIRDERIWFPRNGAGQPRLKLFADQLKGLVPFTIWGASDLGTNDDAKRHLLSMFSEEEVFDTPKPETLLGQILHIASNPGELVVDIFAGSGTTAAVAHKMGRRWIAAERSVQTVDTFVVPRLKRVVEGLDAGGVSGVNGWGGGGGFRLMQVQPRFGSDQESRLFAARGFEASARL